jgi:hypothetical protein
VRHGWLPSHVGPRSCREATPGLSQGPGCPLRALDFIVDQTSPIVEALETSRGLEDEVFRDNVSAHHTRIYQ